MRTICTINKTKQIFTFLILGILLNLVNTQLVIAQPYSNIKITMGYANTNNPITNPLSTTGTELNDVNGQLQDWWLSSSTGESNFNLLPVNTPYNVDVDQSGPYMKPWGGVNATDALLVQKYFVQLIPQNWDARRKAVADVNGSGGLINFTDALIINRRYAGMINTFPVGSWYVDDASFTHPPLVYSHPLQSQTAEYVLSAICYGDVNYSYIPIIPRLKPSIKLNTSGTMIIKSGGGTYDVPIISLDTIIVGAMSLEIRFPQEKYELVDVIMPQSNDSVEAFLAHNGVLKIAWVNTAGSMINGGETLLTLIIQPTDPQWYNSIDGMCIDGNSEITDTSATVYSDVQLVQPKLVFEGTGNDNFEITATPNPANNNVEFAYRIPGEGNVSIKIYNSIGLEVASIDNGRQISDLYHSNLDLSGLASGYYTYVLVFNDRMKMKKLIIAR